jgi:peptidoglycan/xylan/chitin deacetylase (PgdA/CDA1 family)
MGNSHNSYLDEYKITFMTNIRRSNTHTFTVFNYHEVIDDRIGRDPDHSNVRTVSEFKADIAFIKSRYLVLSMPEFIDLIHNNTKEKRKKIALITVDDGLRNHYELIFPLLRSAHVSATFFLNNSFIDNRDLHYNRKKDLILKDQKKGNSQTLKSTLTELLHENKCWNGNVSDSIRSINFYHRLLLDEIAKLVGISISNYLIKEKPYLSKKQIEEMLKEGFAIGGHSFDHPDYYFLSEHEKRYQTIESMNDLQKSFNLNYRVFAFPYGGSKYLNRSFYKSIANSFDASFGMKDVFFGEFPNYFPRISLESSHMPAMAAIKIEYVKSVVNSLKFKFRRFRE